MVAKQLGRDWIGTEASPKYAEMAVERIENPPKPAPLFQPEPDAPLFAQVASAGCTQGQGGQCQ